LNFWRPSEVIKVKALGLALHEGSLLASEILNDAGEVKGVRPLGGTVEFGEAWQDALKREYREELDAEITLSGLPIVMENIYDHHGVTGHEIIFLSNISFVDNALYSQDKILFSENDNTPCTARWFNLQKLSIGGPDLYPTGLLDKLLKYPNAAEK